MLLMYFFLVQKACASYEITLIQKIRPALGIGGPGRCLGLRMRQGLRLFGTFIYRYVHVKIVKTILH